MSARKATGYVVVAVASHCDKRFTTYETVELRLPQVVKQDGNRAEFDRKKLLTSFVRALHKRPVPTADVDGAMDRIVQKLLNLGEREIPTRRIGEMVMEELYKLDKVAYIRFASVYRSFQDADDFHNAIKELQKPQRKKKNPDGNASNHCFLIFLIKQ